MDSKALQTFWFEFFKGAEIPVTDSEQYAQLFLAHRIQKSMLLDLTKEILLDMGLIVLGDIIAILKAAKIYTNQSNSTVLNLNQNENVFKRSPSDSQLSRRSTPASRFVQHYLGNHPDAIPMNDPNPPLFVKQSQELEEIESVTVTYDTSIDKDLPNLSKSRPIKTYTVSSSGDVVLQNEMVPENSVFDRIGVAQDVLTPVVQKTGGMQADKVATTSPALPYLGVLKQTVPKKRTSGETMTAEKKSIKGRLGPVSLDKKMKKTEQQVQKSSNKISLRSRLGPKLGLTSDNTVSSSTDETLNPSSYEDLHDKIIKKNISSGSCTIIPKKWKGNER